MDYTVAENAVMACIQASKTSAERACSGDAEDAIRYAEAARVLAETVRTMLDITN
mgnify:CR=1 FL=1